MHTDRVIIVPLGTRSPPGDPGEPPTPAPQYLDFPVRRVAGALTEIRGGTAIDPSYYWWKPPYPTTGSVYTTLSSFETAINAAAPGDVLRLDDGTYTDQDITITASGTAAAPIKVVADNFQAAVLDGRKITVQGDYVWVMGFEDATFDIYGNDVIVAYCHRSGDGQVWATTWGNRFRLCFNTIENTQQSRNVIWVHTDSIAPQGRVDHNRFLNHQGSDVTPGQSEIITFGQDEQLSPDWYCVFDSNYIYRHLYNPVDGSRFTANETECIGLKANSVMVLNNVFHECNSFVSVRTGNRATVGWNWFYGGTATDGGCITAGGIDNLFIGNHVTDLNSDDIVGMGLIQLVGGDPNSLSSTGIPDRKEATRNEVVFNTGYDVKRGIALGRVVYPILPTNNYFANNAIKEASARSVVWLNNSAGTVWDKNVFGPNVGVSDSDITPESPLLTSYPSTLATGAEYRSITNGGNCDTSGEIVGDMGPITRALNTKGWLVDIYGNEISATNIPDQGAIQKYSRVSDDSMQRIKDAAGSEALQEAVISIQFSSYSFDEGTTQQIKLLRTVRIDQVISVNWSISGVAVTPTSGTEIFQVGESEKTITLTGLTVSADDTGTMTLVNLTRISGPLTTPQLGTISTASITVQNVVVIPPEPTDRNLRAEIDFETGLIQHEENQVNGVFKDALFVQMQEPYDLIEITNITISSPGQPAVATYSASSRHPTDIWLHSRTYQLNPSGTATITAPEGLTLPNTGGIPQLRGRLIRPRNVNTGNRTFEVYQDGIGDNWDSISQTGQYDYYAALYPNNLEIAASWDDRCHGLQPCVTNGMTPFSGGSIFAQTWRAEHDGSGNPGRISTAEGVGIKVRGAGFTPPITTNGTAQPMNPLRGNYFLDSTLRYNSDYTADTTEGAGNGLGNDGGNKPRFTMNPKSRFFPNQEEWISFSIYIPTNYVSETSSSEVSTVSGNQLFLIPETPSVTSTNTVELRLEHEHSGKTLESWALQVRNQQGYTEIMEIGDDIGKWTTWIFRIKCHDTQGILQVWKSVGDYVTGFQRRMQRVTNYTSGYIGVSGSTAYGYWLRQYKFAWHQRINNHDSPHIFLGWDEIRFGGVNEGTRFEDVHPFKHTESEALNLTVVGPRQGIAYTLDGSLGSIRAVGEDQGMRIAGHTLTYEPGGASGTYFYDADGDGNNEYSQWRNYSGGQSLGANSEARIVANGYVEPTTAKGPGRAVNARIPSTGHFLVSELHKEHHYWIFHSAREDDDKPRTWLYPFNNGNVTETKISPMRYDETFWFGISIYVPSNWEDETHSYQLDEGPTVINGLPAGRVSLGNITPSAASEDFWHGPQLYTPDGAGGKTYWYLDYCQNQNRVNEGNRVYVPCGSTVDDGDLGNWTDWVFRMRVNPFTGSSGVNANSRDPVEGVNKVYQPNRGIFQAWKSYGPVNANGNRQFRQVANLVGGSFGNVPKGDPDNLNLEMALTWTPRIYWGNWDPLGIQTSNPGYQKTSTRFGPVMLGYDEFRIGIEADGCGFQDINPGRLPEP